MKFSLILLCSGALYIASGIFFSRIDFSTSIPQKDLNTTAPLFYDYAGVLNVQSKKSKGSRGVHEIIKSATAANLDFIIFNESNPIDQQQPRSIKYGKLNVLYGLELNFKNSRILHFTSDKMPLFSSYSEMQIYISNFLETGGEGAMVMSHPDKPGYEWSSTYKPAFMTGMEVLNLREVWRTAWQSRKFSFLSALIFYPFNPQFFFLDIYADDALSINLWDEWNKARPLVGYVGSDATSKLRVTKNFHLEFPSYKSIFQMAKNHVLLKEEMVGFGDQASILEALKKGSSYFSIDILGDPAGFAFWAEDEGKDKIMMGETIAIDKVAKLKVMLPNLNDEVRIELFQNGDLLKTFTNSFEFTPEEMGVYRVVVKTNPLFPLMRGQKWIPWIFSNPVFITGSVSQ